MTYRDKVIEFIHNNLDTRQVTLKDFHGLLGGIRATDKKGSSLIFYYDVLNNTVRCLGERNSYFNSVIITK